MKAKVSKARLSSRLFDCKWYVKGIESLYEKMWMRYEKAELPEHIRASDEGCLAKKLEINASKTLSGQSV